MHKININGSVYDEDDDDEYIIYLKMTIFMKMKAFMLSTYP